jgi:RND family efflux transporter MFP subunit
MNQRIICILVLVCAAFASVLWVRTWQPPPVVPPPRQQQEEVAVPRVVTVSRAIERKVADYEEFVGKTEPSDVAQVRARVGGTLAVVRCKVGDRVGKGDVLFEFDAKPYQKARDKAEADVKRLEEQGKEKAAEYEKAEKRRDAGTITQAELDKVRDKLQRVEADLLTARTALEQARIDQDSTQAAAPIAGTIREVPVAHGETLAPGVLLAVVATLDPMLVRFEMNQAAWLRAHQRLWERTGRPEPGTPLQMRLDGASIIVSALGQYANRPTPWQSGWLAQTMKVLEREKGFPHQGTIQSADEPITIPGKPTDPHKVRPSQERRWAVRGFFPNADGAIPPGQACRVRLPLGQPRPVLLITDGAVVREGKQDYLLVVNNRNVVEYRPVQLGQLCEGLRVIEAGLAASDWVVVTGVQRVRKGEVVEPQRNEERVQKDEG